VVHSMGEKELSSCCNPENYLLRLSFGFEPLVERSHSGVVTDRELLAGDPGLLF